MLAEADADADEAEAIVDEGRLDTENDDDGDAAGTH